MRSRRLTNDPADGPSSESGPEGARRGTAAANLAAYETMIEPALLADANPDPRAAHRRSELETYAVIDDNRVRELCADLENSAASAFADAWLFDELIGERDAIFTRVVTEERLAPFVALLSAFPKAQQREFAGAGKSGKTWPPGFAAASREMLTAGSQVVELDVRVRAGDAKGAIAILARYFGELKLWFNQPGNPARLRSLLLADRSQILGDPQMRDQLGLLVRLLRNSADGLAFGEELLTAVYGARVTKGPKPGRARSAGNVDAEVADDLLLADTIVPPAHAAFVSTAFTIEYEPNASNAYIQFEKKRIALPQRGLVDPLLHEMGHAIDAALGFPSEQLPELFGWRSLTAEGLAQATRLDTIEDPRTAAAIRATYEDVMAGGESWQVSLASRLGDDKAAALRAVIDHPAYLVGAMAEPTAKNIRGIEPPFVDGQRLMLHGAKMAAFSLTEERYAAYVALGVSGLTYAPRECFADLYALWFSAPGTHGKFPPALARYFTEVVEPFKPTTPSPDASARTPK